MHLRRIIIVATMALALFATLGFAGETPEQRTRGSAQAVTLAELLEHPDRYVGRNIRIEGRIQDVCPKAGCWIDIANDAGQSIRFKVNDGEIVFDVDNRGREVIAEGIFRRYDLTRDQSVARARHLAEEKGETFDPASVREAQTYYQIQGSGAIVR